jgi:hypothetical protein
MIDTRRPGDPSSFPFPLFSLSLSLSLSFTSNRGKVLLDGRVDSLENRYSPEATGKAPRQLFSRERRSDVYSST